MDNDSAAALLPNLLLLAMLFVLFYLLLMRPQRKRAEAHRQLVQSVEVGDEIMTTAGIFGRVTEVHDDDMMLEIAPGTAIRVARAAIARREEGEGAGSEGDERP